MPKINIGMPVGTSLGITGSGEIIVHVYPHREMEAQTFLSHAPGDLPSALSTLEKAMEVVEVAQDMLCAHYAPKGDCAGCTARRLWEEGDAS